MLDVLVPGVAGLVIESAKAHGPGLGLRSLHLVSGLESLFRTVRIERRLPRSSQSHCLV